MRGAVHGRSLDTDQLATIDEATVGNENSRDSSRHTSIKLLSVALEGAVIVHLDLVSLLGLALALDLSGDINLELRAGSGKRRQSKDQDGGLHCGKGGDWYGSEDEV